MTDRTGTKFTHRGERTHPNKLARKLDRQGSVYGRVSLVSQTFNDIQARKFKDARRSATKAV